MSGGNDNPLDGITWEIARRSASAWLDAKTTYVPVSVAQQATAEVRDWLGEQERAGTTLVLPPHWKQYVRPGTTEVAGIGLLHLVEHVVAARRAQVWSEARNRDKRFPAMASDNPTRRELLEARLRDRADERQQLRGIEAGRRAIAGLASRLNTTRIAYADTAQSVHVLLTAFALQRQRDLEEAALSTGLRLLALREGQLAAIRALDAEPELAGATSAPPPAQPYGVSHRGAEELCAAWMRHLYVPDAEATRYSRDGGVDVTSKRIVAQVKNYTGSVSAREVREVFGAATAMQRDATIFTSGTLTRDAQEFCDAVGMPVFRYNAERGLIGPLNAIASLCLELRSIPAGLARSR